MASNDLNIDPKVAAKKFMQDKRYTKLVNTWGTKDLKMIIDDRSKALEYGRKGIEVTEPDMLNDKYINQMADAIQEVAKMILKKRELKR